MTARILCLALVLASAASARADVAPPSPESLECPRGAQGAVPTIPAGTFDERGRPLRAWPYCAPTTCATDADCTGGRVCSTEEIGLCVEDQDASGTTVRAARERSCEPDGTCLNLQSTCERARRCVAAAEPPAPPTIDPAPPAPSPSVPAPAPASEPAPQSTWGCRATAGSSTSIVAPLLALAALARRRRSNP